MSHVPQLYDVVNLLKYWLKYSIFLFFQRNRCGRESDGAVFWPKNAETTLCLKGCNICLQEDRRVKIGSMSP